MQLDPALSQGCQAAVFFHALHHLVGLLGQVESVNLKVAHGFKGQEFNVLGAVEELEEVVVLALYDVIVDQCRHSNLVLRDLLESWSLDKLVMLGQNVVHVNFLEKNKEMISR